MKEQDQIKALAELDDKEYLGCGCDLCNREVG